MYFLLQGVHLSSNLGALRKSYIHKIFHAFIKLQHSHCLFRWRPKLCKSTLIQTSEYSWDTVSIHGIVLMLYTENKCEMACSILITLISENVF